MTSSLISRAVANEEDLRTKVSIMLSLIRQEIGNPRGQRIAVIATGSLEDYETALLRSLLRSRADIRANGVRMAQLKTSELATVADGAAAVLIVGGGLNFALTPEQLTANMGQKVILDTQDERQYAGKSFADYHISGASGITRELFFGQREKEERDAIAKKQQQARFRTIWIALISLLVTIIGIANALLMSVTERFKEIGTMKCLGALSSFIRQLFLIESAVIGLVGSLAGILIGILFPMIIYSFAYGFANVFGAISYSQLGLISLGSLAAGTLLSIVAAIYPATIAARMIPAMALRSNV